MLIGKPYLVLDEYHFSQYVSEHYKRPYCLQQQGDKLSNGSAVFLSVPGEGCGDHYEAVSLEEWLNTPVDAYKYDFEFTRECYPELEIVASDLHAKGLLAAGEYIIQVD